MSHSSDGDIIYPVNLITDVKTVLGETTNTISGLCSSSKINMWSKHKPVQISSTFPDRSGNWWEGDNTDCSMAYLYKTKFSDAFNVISQNTKAWWCKLPDGTTYPYRLLDFDGYYHSATSPISGVQILKINNTYYFNLQDGSSSKSLSLKDLVYLKNNYYFTVIIVKPNGAKRAIWSSPVVLGQDGGYSTSLNSEYLDTPGTWKAYFFLTTDKINAILPDGTTIKDPGGRITFLPKVAGNGALGPSNIYLN